MDCLVFLRPGAQSGSQPFVCPRKIKIFFPLRICLNLRSHPIAHQITTIIMAKKTAASKTPVFSARKKSGITGHSAISLTKGLAGGRPQALFASKHTRQIIRRHHTLLKKQTALKVQLKAAAKGGAEARRLALQIEQLEKEIEENGGIHEYQKASIAGQSSARGGDTSKLLIQWMQQTWPEQFSDTNTPIKNKFSLLEVGSLSAENECSTCGYFDPIERIDLNSQDPEHIKQQDFMKRPLPKSDAERFDLISLSLVVNYVPDHFERGEMLRRTTQFLKKPAADTKASAFPGLFFVLPAPCVLNSRYFTEARLLEIMTALGYTMQLRKESSKLLYWFFRLTGPPQAKLPTFKRTELNPGSSRNNFSICLK